MREPKNDDILFYNQSGVVEVGIVTNIALDGWVTVINNCTKTTVAPLNFVEVITEIPDNLRKEIGTFE